VVVRARLRVETHALAARPQGSQEIEVAQEEQSPVHGVERQARHLASYGPVHRLGVGMVEALGDLAVDGDALWRQANAGGAERRLAPLDTTRDLLALDGMGAVVTLCHS
jgi:hypothetical protein